MLAEECAEKPEYRYSYDPRGFIVNSVVDAEHKVVFFDVFLNKKKIGRFSDSRKVADFTRKWMSRIEDFEKEMIDDAREKSS